MKVKLPITEQFLWDVYNILEELGRIGGVFGPHSLKEVGFPELRQMRHEARRRYGRRNFAQLIYYLKKKELIKAPDWDPKSGIIITEKGMEKIFRVGLKVRGKQRRTDGKYQMVVFDISEKKRKARDELRLSLKLLGHKEFQKSIWISPYEVLKETQNLISRYNLEDEAKIFIIEKP